MWLDTNGCESFWHSLDRVDGQVVVTHSDNSVCGLVEFGEFADQIQGESRARSHDQGIRQLDRFAVAQKDSESDRALAEAHRRLDEAKIPSARNTVCDDPKCQSQVGHRIMVLTEQRDALASALREILCNPPTFSDERLRYETIQVDKADLEAAKAALAGMEPHAK